MDCSPPGSLVHGIFQAWILGWVAISFSRGSSWPRDRTQVSCIDRKILYQLSYKGIPKKGNAKECSNCCTIVLISHASKVMLKILQAKLQQYVNCELPDVQGGFRKGRENRDQSANIHWIIKKAREFQKNIYFCFIVTPKPLTMWITTNCGKFFKIWEYQANWPASWEICIQVSK